MRRKLGILCALLALTLAACGSTAGKGGSAAVGEPTATLSPTVSATLTPTMTATPTTPQRCPTMGGASTTQAGDLTISNENVLLAYPSAQLPDNFPQAPYKLQGTPNNQFTGSAWSCALPINPYIIDSSQLMIQLGVGIGNTSTTKAHTISGVAVKIVSFTPLAAINNGTGTFPCGFSYFTRPNQVIGGSGCGGATVFDTYQHASFGASATAGATVTATNGGQFSMGGDKTLPYALPHGATLDVAVSITLAQPGIYTLAAGVSVDGAAPVFTGAAGQVYVGPITHKFSGTACQTSAMLAQIPTAVTNPPSYYICP